MPLKLDRRENVGLFDLKRVWKESEANPPTILEVMPVEDSTTYHVRPGRLTEVVAEASLRQRAFPFFPNTASTVLRHASGGIAD
jgi:hypothetical protein